MRKPLLLLALLAFAPLLVAQDFAVKQLDASPRHHEWVEIPAKGRVIRSFVAYPQKKENAQTVLVIHENRGLTDWIRSFADQMAAEGYLAIAPDLLSGFDEKHRHTAQFESSDAARNAIYELDPMQVIEDLLAVQRYAIKIPSAREKLAVVGFCWGGSIAFRLASFAPDLSAILVFYGSPPTDAAEIRAISAPVYGFYGENDQRINATIPETQKRMKAQGKTYEIKIYDGAGHAFMRLGDDPNGPAADRKARHAAWDRMRRILSRTDPSTPAR